MRTILTKLILWMFLAVPIVSHAPAAEPVTFTEHETLTFTGSSATNTRPFTVSQEWELQWEKTGEWPSIDLFMVQVSEKGSPLSVAAWTLSGQAGTAYIPKTGEFYLQITAMGPWKISIVELTR